MPAGSAATLHVILALTLVFNSATCGATIAVAMLVQQAWQSPAGILQGAF
jgi:hypothetical protein